MKGFYRTKPVGLLLIFLMLYIGAHAQERAAADTLNAKHIKTYKEQVKGMVKFLEYSLNTLGDPEAARSDKETIIQESYKKFFRDSLVQVEDDLDPNRDMPLSKDVQAYMKDVVFFYKKAQFTYEILEVEHFVAQGQQLSFKVTANRHLKGINSDGEKIDNHQERFVEVNLDETEEQLKIVSIYTHNINRDEELRQWWMQLSLQWRKTLGEPFALTDSVDMSDVTNFNDTIVRYYLDTLDVKPAQVHKQLKRIVEQKEVDVSGEGRLRTLSGLTKLAGLKKLNISQTSVDDLTPIRNLTKLEQLQAELTPLTTLDPLRFATAFRDINLQKSALLTDISAVQNFSKLTRLQLEGTKVDDLSPLRGLPNLRDLRLAKTPVSQLGPLQGLAALEYLDISHTIIKSLDSLQGLEKLEQLNAQHTPVSDISPLEGLKALKVVNLDHTQIKSLEALSGLPALRRVYCDNTPIDKAQAMKFMETNPECVVIYDSETLQKWWKNLGPAWKKLLKAHLEIEKTPDKADLHRLLSLTKLDAQEETDILSLAPLSRLGKIQELDISGTGVEDLTPLSDLLNLRRLQISNTRVKSLKPLAALQNLEFLDASATSINQLAPLNDLPHLESILINETLTKQLSPLKKMPALQEIWAEGSFLDKEGVAAFQEKFPDVLVVFRTQELKSWWRGLSDTWKTVLRQYEPVESAEDTVALHRLTVQSELEITQQPDIVSLLPLQKFISLRRLVVTHTGISGLEPLSAMTKLEILDVSDHHQIKKLAPLTRLKNLQALAVANTAVEELEPLAKLNGLTMLNVSGTKIGFNGLSPLEAVESLQVVNFSNTDVRLLKPLYELPKLKEINSANTKVLDMFVNRFREKNPNCKVVHY